MKKLHKIILALLVISFTSCASYSNKISKDQQSELTKSNIHSIEGVYEFEAFESFVSKGGDVYEIDNDIEYPDYYILGTRLKLNPADVTMVVKIVSKNKISFTLKRKNTFLFEKTIKMKLRPNGFIHLKNKHVEIIGVPLLIGGIESEKMRIGISENGDLLLHYAYDIFGSLIFFSSGTRYNRTHYYKKINPSV